MAKQLTNAQVDAINHLLQDMSGIKKTVVQHCIKELNNILMQDELPERLMVVARGWAETDTLLVVTDSRAIFVSEMFGLSTTPQLKIEDFPFDRISSLEYKPRMGKHQILFRANGKKQSFNVPWWDGKFKARQVAEYLHSKSGTNAIQPGSLQNSPGVSPFAKDDKEAKAFAIEDAVRGLNDLDGGDRILQVGGELKKLPEILEDGELPERLLPATYDERRGLQVSKFSNRQGLLVATDSRLIFVDKDMTRLTVHDFAYNSISYAEVSTGMMFGKLTIHVSRNQEVFEGDSDRIQRMGKHISDKISSHAVAPALPVRTRNDDINEALLRLGCSPEVTNQLGIRHLPETLEKVLENERSAREDDDMYARWLEWTAIRHHISPYVCISRECGPTGGQCHTRNPVLLLL